MKKEKMGLMLFAVALGTFMSALDASVVNISVPVIKTFFGVSLAAVQWIITAYLMVVSSVLLFFGRLSDLYGQKRVYMTGFAVFTAGSALCGLAMSAEMLILFRVFQALGAGMMFSTNAAIITHNVPAERRGRAFSVIAIAVAAALSAGPVLGGVLTGAFGWQSIFYINVPVGIFGLIIAARFIPSDKKTPKSRLDISGSIMIFGTLFLILLPLDQWSEGMNIYLAIAMFISGVSLAVVFIRYEKKTRNPLLKLELFRNRVFSASLIAAVFNFMAQYIMIFLVPFYLQTIRLFTPAKAGLLYIPMPLAVLAVAPVAGFVSDRFDTRYISTAGMGIMAVGLFMLSFLNAQTPLVYIVLAMSVTGIGSGLFQTPNNSALMNNVPAEHRGVASGMLATARNIGMVLGVGISGALFTWLAGWTGSQSAESSLTSTTAGQTAFIHAMHVTYIVAAVIALIAMAASFTKGKVKTAAMLEAESEAENPAGNENKL